ncbi:SWIM zinc finger family protein [Streptomyces globisporus]|uniref:SWIM zinc finger family protein n=1 Tax=Streptomyces globisporus TaxID=1908 RepID=UPI0036777803
MNHTNVWADSFDSTACAAIGDREALLDGRSDLDQFGIRRFLISPGRVSGLVTARNTGMELQAAITLPILTADQTAALRTAAAQCAHHHSDGPALPACLSEHAFSVDVRLLPNPSELQFVCTCPSATPCRHAAALAHALIDQLRTHPDDLATLRGLRQPVRPPQDLPAAITNANPETMPPARQLSAHHAWAWYRDCPDLSPAPDYSPVVADVPACPSGWSPPPSPAPSAEHLHALIRDAASHAAGFLRSGTPLECAWEDDTLRLTARIPNISIPDIADRLGLDIADLRNRLVEHSSAARRA